MPDIGFIQINWLWLLPLPILWLHMRSLQKKNWPTLIVTKSIRYPLQQHAVKSLKSNNKLQYHPKQDLLACCAFVLLLIAMAQPVSYMESINSPDKTAPVDLVLLVDTSLTMVLKDYVIDGEPVDRMSMTRRLLNNFIQAYSGSRIGLSVMGNPPYHWLPYTSDKTILSDAVSRIRTTMGGRMTDMSASLQMINEQYTSEDDKVVVMITDGVLQLGKLSPQEAAKKLSEHGYTLYIIAIGSTQIDASQSDTSGLIYEPVNLALLQDVAEHGNGQMFHAVDSTAFSHALKTIESKHRKIIDASDAIQPVKSWYPYPLFSGIFLLLFTAVSSQITLPKHGVRA